MTRARKYKILFAPMILSALAVAIYKVHNVVASLDPVGVFALLLAVAAAVGILLIVRQADKF